LAAEFPGSAHVRDFSLVRASDPAVWSHAAAQGFVIVSKDVDFQQRALLMGHPPKGKNRGQKQGRELYS